MLFDIVNIKYAHFRADIYMVAIAMQLFMTSLFIHLPINYVWNYTSQLVSELLQCKICKHTMVIYN